MRLGALLPLALVLLLLLSAATLASSARGLQAAPRQGGTARHAALSRSIAAGGGAAQPTYPKGDCATECSVDPAARMAACAADPQAGIPATTCQAAAPEDPDVCPTLRYPDAFRPEAYCMPRFAADCAHPANFGCSRRCSLYLVVAHQCVADAYDPSSAAFNASCVACNMCYGRAPADGPAYALLWARGPSGALFKNHWLVLPKQACSGIESATPGCTDARAELLWGSAYREARALGFNDSGGAGAGGQQEQEPTWALWLNAPNRRGVHQMHIHIAHFESRRVPPDVPASAFLVRRVAAADPVSVDPAAPTRVLGEGFYDVAAFAATPLRRPPRDWARAYVVFVPTADPERELGRTIRPFELGRALSAASDLPAHSYGVFVMLRRFSGGGAGLLVGVAWSTTDSEQLDEEELPGDPIRYSHSCHQFIGTNGTAAAAAAPAATVGGVA